MITWYSWYSSTNNSTTVEAEVKVLRSSAIVPNYVYIVLAQLHNEFTSRRRYRSNSDCETEIFGKLANFLKKSFSLVLFDAY